MFSRTKYFMLIAAAVFLLQGATVRSEQLREFISVYSRYLGEGNFEYTFEVREEPMFYAVGPQSLVISATNFLSSLAPPVGWTDGTNNSATIRYWEYGNGHPTTTNAIVAPYRVSFGVKGDSTFFKRARQMILLGSLWPYQFTGSRVVAGNVVFFMKFEVLVPCPAGEADGSAPSAYSSFPGGPNIEIDQLGMIDGQIRTVAYRFPYLSTVRLQATTNYSDWSNVATIFGVPPMTAWTSSVPLETFGNAFRLALVADRHLTNLPSLVEESGNRLAVAGKPASVRSIEARDNCPVVITVASRKGARVRVSVEDIATMRIVTREAVGAGEILSLEFPEFSDSLGAVIRAVELD